MRCEATRKALRMQESAKLDATALAEILQRVKEDSNVTTLNLCRSGVTPSLAVQLADFLETNSTLTHVDLSGNRLGEHGAGCLATSLMKNSSVSSLVLSDCGLDGEALTKWVDFFRTGTNTTLSHLILANNQIDDDGAQTLGSMLQAVKTRYFHLDLRKNKLSTQGLQVLADAMKDACPTSVTAVQVEDNQDDDEPAAMVYRSRMEFYMRRNKAAIGREILHETITQIGMSSLTLEVCHLKHVEITIAEADSLGAALRNNHSITELRLQDNALPEEGARRLLLALRNNRSVRRLALVDNNIGDGGFRALSELLRMPTTALRDVTVSNPSQLTPRNGLKAIKAPTLSALHYTFANYTLLTSLSLANCGLNDLAIGVLVSGIAWSGRIEALDLQRNGFGDRSVYVLDRMMQRCQQLYRLDLSGNNFTLDGLLPLFPSISFHRQLRVLLLGRFLSCERSTLNQIIASVKQSSTVVQLELKTTNRRESTNERVEKLNTELSAAKSANFERQKRQRRQTWEVHAAWCRRRALVYQEARAIVIQATSAQTKKC